MAEGQLDAAAVTAALNGFSDPESGQNLVEAGQVHDVKVDGDKVSLTLGLSTHSAILRDETVERLRQFLHERLPAAKDVTVKLTVHKRPPEKIGQIGLAAKSVVAVGSGKGGVGKSTIAAALAIGLVRAGSQVGLMDADVYGPSIPHLLGVNRRPEIVENRIRPIEVDGIKVISMGFLVPPGEAVVWRGPMLHGAITQFLRDTAWGGIGLLDYRHAPGHRRHRLDAFAAFAPHRRGRGLHAAGPGAVGRRQGRGHVPQGEHPDFGHGRKHERLCLSRLPKALRYFRLGRRQGARR